MAKESINANEYYASATRLYIIPTEEDLKRFGKSLTKGTREGLRSFRLNSTVGKSWDSFVRNNEIKFKYKPFVGTYFNAYGTSRSRLFNVGKTVYCSYECEYDFKNPEGLIEIKASEFYKAVEDDN